MKTIAFMGRAFAEGVKSWKESWFLWLMATVLSASGLVLVGSRFWSWNYLWQGVALLAVSALLAVGNGAFVLAEAQTSEATALLTEIDRLSNSTPPTVPPPARPTSAAVWMDGTHGGSVSDVRIDGLNVNGPHPAVYGAGDIADIDIRNVDVRHSPD